MRELEYPFDNFFIIRNRKKIKSKLLEQLNKKDIIKKNIAILGGSTTTYIKEILELFLLDNNIVPTFYESDYAQYWNDVMFDNNKLIEFKPDVIFVHTTSRNIKLFPTVRNSSKSIETMLLEEFSHFEVMWEKISKVYKCPIIQNNFEQPFFRLLGNRDVWDIHGKTNFITQLNQRFYEYAQLNENFYINDINYISSCYGIQKWSEPLHWYAYKYALCIEAIPEFAYNLSNIIKSIYGKNKKAIVCDLDNTLWGGNIGDDGIENIEIGKETTYGQLYTEFQSYLKAHKDLGILLAANSKNEEKNALKGLMHPNSILKPNDFITIKSNWNSKDKNIVDIASELNIGTDTIVFIDDNPAEREIVNKSVGEIATPKMSDAEQYINILDRSGFFETTQFSMEDLNRNEVYKSNIKRLKCKNSFVDYNEYLVSLKMRAEIKPFTKIYTNRIAQLINKSNQFNLTSLKCTQSDIENFIGNEKYITLYGKLEDKFGDNGIVSVAFGHIDNSFFHIDLLLMSCRVLNRCMEKAMMDSLIYECKKRKISKVYGYYYKTEKNDIVKNFYADNGFIKNSEDNGNTVWELEIKKYKKQNHIIGVNL